MSIWPIYTGTGVPHDGIDQLPGPSELASIRWRAAIADSQSSLIQGLRGGSDRRKVPATSAGP